MGFFNNELWLLEAIFSLEYSYFCLFHVFLKKKYRRKEFVYVVGDFKFKFTNNVLNKITISHTLPSFSQYIPFR